MGRKKNTTETQTDNTMGAETPPAPQSDSPPETPAPTRTRSVAPLAPEIQALVQEADARFRRQREAAKARKKELRGLNKLAVLIAGIQTLDTLDQVKVLVGRRWDAVMATLPTAPGPDNPLPSEQTESA